MYVNMTDFFGYHCSIGSLNCIKIILVCVYVALFMCNHCVVCVSFTNGFYKITAGKRLQNIFETNTAFSKTACCTYCGQTTDCKSVNYDDSSKECQLSKEPYVYVSVNAQTDETCTVYSKEDWVLVFRGSRGAGGDVYTGWINGDSVTSDDVTCMTTDVTSCSQHYRNPIVDLWSSIGIGQVKFAFYKNSIEEAYIVFNATGSNVTDWFTKSRVIQSSWTHLASDAFNYFSIYGHSPGRRFFINRHYGGCPVDTAYSIVVTENSFFCNHDNHTAYPQFLYANSSTYGHPDPMIGFDKADVMAIFIK